LQIGLNDAVRVERLRHLAQRSRREPGLDQCGDRIARLAAPGLAREN
jgi:hypothetical protein